MKCSKTRRISAKSWLLALAVVLSLPAAARAQGQATVDVQGARIELGTLSKAAPRELLHLDIAPAPRPGQSVRISRDAVRHALRRAGADPHLADALPPLQTVRRTAKQLEKAELRDEIVHMVSDKLPLGVAVGEILGLRDITLPEGQHQVDVRLSRLRRATPASVRISAEGRTWATFAVTINLLGQAQTPVPTRDIASSAVIRSGDIAFVDTELDALPQRAVLRRDELVGRAATARLSAGKPVQSRELKVPPTVVRGKTVTLIAASKGLRITQTARVEEDGKTGDWVRVQPLTGAHQIKAQVVSASEVRIVLGAQP